MVYPTEGVVSVRCLRVEVAERCQGVGGIQAPQPVKQLSGPMEQREVGRLAVRISRVAARVEFCLQGKGVRGLVWHETTERRV